ncbi:hypothetical protein BRAS3843_1780055 [Bradyrhizobium sp. STM 3843]|nr:hypothetical protein BRAS3843_1780055 [Bradyrhizobium sp. STM 3843]
MRPCPDSQAAENRGDLPDMAGSHARDRLARRATRVEITRIFVAGAPSAFNPRPQTPDIGGRATYDFAPVLLHTTEIERVASEDIELAAAYFTYLSHKLKV